MQDTINIENAGTDNPETWITIKDASDLLSISKRHAWNVIKENGFKTQKLLDQHRKKTYVLRADIEKYKSERIAEGDFEISEGKKTLLSERDLRVKNLPALLKDMQARQETLLKDATKWKVTAFWTGILTVVVAGVLLFFLAEIRERLLERETALSESQKSLSAMYERILGLADRERETLKTLTDKEIYIEKLKGLLPERKLKKLKGQDDGQ